MFTKGQNFWRGVRTKKMTFTQWKTRTILIFAFLLVFPLVVFADNLVVDGDGLMPVSTNAMNLGNICQGQSASGNALLAIQRTGGGQLQNVFSNGSNVTVSAGTPSDPYASTSFTDNGIALPGNWTSAGNNTMSSDMATAQVTAVAAGSPGAKSATIVYSANGTRASDGAALSRTATLTVNWTVTVCDTTPPVITPNVTGTLGSNGWYVSDVTVSWSVTDAESAISSSSGCDTTAINSDTAGLMLTCNATSAGGTNSQFMTIKRDATAPTIFGAASPAPNGNGWNNSDVNVSFTCADNLSGVAACGPDQSLTSDGWNQSASGTATDEAGNSASDTVNGINIDKTAPQVAVTGVSHGAMYILGTVPAAGCTTTDALSGVASPAALSGGGSGVGNFTVTCSGAADNAGNAGAEASATYNVIYSWNGFFQPVENPGAGPNYVFNRVKAGSAVPMKFSLSGYQGLSIFMTGYPRSEKVSCTNVAVMDDVTETVNAGNSSLSYDAAADQYNYVWKTDKGWGGTCRKFTFQLIDGQQYVAYFNFTK